VELDFASELMPDCSNEKVVDLIALVVPSDGLSIMKSESLAPFND